MTGPVLQHKTLYFINHSLTLTFIHTVNQHSTIIRPTNVSGSTHILVYQGQSWLRCYLATCTCTCKGGLQRITLSCREERFREALHLLPSHLVMERLMLKSLHQNISDSDYAYKQALFSIPQDSRFFYVQSFCSVLWNHTASYRLREYGPRLVEGDLVVQGSGRRWWEGEGEVGSPGWRNTR